MTSLPTSGAETPMASALEHGLNWPARRLDYPMASVQSAWTELAALRQRASESKPDGWEWTHEHQAKLIERDGWMCEAHPGREWPHEDCAGPGMPWMIEGRGRILAALHGPDAKGGAE